MRVNRLAHRLSSLLVVFSLLTTYFAPVVQAQDAGPIYLPFIARGGTDVPASNLLFRTLVSVRTPAMWTSLNDLAPVILERGDDWALLLVDDEQLETLARRSYLPEGTDTLEALSRSNATAPRSMTLSLQALFAQAADARRQLDTLPTDPTERSAEEADSLAASLRAGLRQSLQALDLQTRSALALTASVDTDADGLNDTLEGYWCTDPNNADSDFDSVSDGAEVTALKNWVHNSDPNKLRSQFPSSGKPFIGWPPDHAGCFDADKDSVPDRVETTELGLSPSRESTDRDKFDDGQELFGLTHCTGQGGFCSYGPLPRNEDWGIIVAEMPSWVKAPGNHPLVGAFPAPEVDVHISTIIVQSVTDITTDYLIQQGSEESYTTAKTDGLSTSVANTKTWNKWQEVSEAFSQRVSESSRDAEHVDAPRFIMIPPGSLEYATLSTEDERRLEADTKYMANCNIRTVYAEGTIKVVTVGGEAAELPPLAELRCKNTLQELIEDYPELADEYTEKLAALANSYDASISITNPITISNIINNNFDSSGIIAGLQGLAYSYDQSGRLIGHRLQEISSILKAPIRTDTTLTGQSEGGSRTVEHTEYQEHTITNGEAFSSSESWGNGTAVDSAHAADMWFSYSVRNTGTEYAHEICNLAFNVYLNEDLIYTYVVAEDRASACFNALEPGEVHTFSARTGTHAIPLSLEQLKQLDVAENCDELRRQGVVPAYDEGGRCPGGKLRIVVEDFTYGIDERFYLDAANAGVLIALEDGTSDGDETIDSYLIPTWDSSDKVLDVVARYFPHQTDSNGTLIAIWTPEYRSTNPAWCQEPKRPTDYPNRAVWCKHVLSTADWWNVYSDGLGDGSEGLQQTLAQPGAVALFRFNKDTDLDGFSDRSEQRLGTDINDAASFPQPELLAGLHCGAQNGALVTCTLSLLNTGSYDAYGVEAIMVAPDASISIVNNTVGGSGRVRAFQQVIVGSRIQLPSPLPAAWLAAGHATPAAGGYYTGSSDRAYTFTVANCPVGGCTVGSGAWTLNWSDGTTSGTLPFGAGYAAPTFLPVGSDGVTLALQSGTVTNGDTFVLQAQTPRDTFQYNVVDGANLTPPLVIVSYNDPQGNHRFVIPAQAMSLASPTADLSVFAGQMLDNVGLELVTQQAFTAGSNSVDLLVNNPSPITLTDANLFLELVNISGTVVSEVSQPVTLAPGPTYTTLSFDSAQFVPVHNPAEDYIVLAFLTDYQGNILDTTGRPLSSFQEDPLPNLAGGPVTWDLGSVAQGDLRTLALPLANTGFGRLYTYLEPVTGFTLDIPARTVGAADMLGYRLLLHSADLPVGAINQTLTLRTSDPDTPTVNIAVTGEIVAAAEDQPIGAIQRPLDVAVTVDGPRNAGDTVEFSHNIGPQPESMHPCKIFNSSYGVLYGVGEACTDFSGGTASAAMFGNGADGPKTVSGEETFGSPRTPLAATVNAGATSIVLADAAGFNVGDELLIIQIQGTGAGNYEFRRVTAKSTNTLTLDKALTRTYTQGGSSKAQIVRVPNYTDVTVTATGRWRAPAWDGNTGGILAFRATGTVNVESGGLIDVSGKGFRGASRPANSTRASGKLGESYAGTYDAVATSRNQNYSGGGGAYNNNADAGSGGGGGGYATVGGVGVGGHWTNGSGPGIGGSAIGDAELSTVYLGGGGGSGSNSYTSGGGNDFGGAGGTGAGILIIGGKTVSIAGQILSNGANGTASTGHATGGGGAGAGGTVYVQAASATIGTSQIKSSGGIGGSGGAFSIVGGSGGDGRIRIEYCDTLIGTSSPVASTQKLNCYIAEQGSAPAGSEVVSSAIFGDGRDGVMPSSGNLDNTKGFAAGNVSGTQGTTSIIVTDRHQIVRVNPGDVVLIHQTRGSGAGNWELNKAVADFTGSGTFTLQEPLEHTYVTNTGNEKAQILRVPQYTDCPVTGTVTPLASWNGEWGGIFAVKCAGVMTVEGQITAYASGYRGGSGRKNFADTGEGNLAASFTTTNGYSNGSAGGGAHHNGNSNNIGIGGGGGGNGTSGVTSGGGQTHGGIGGNAIGSDTLEQIFFGGSGGGGAGGSSDHNPNIGGDGGSGGGIILVWAESIAVSGSVDASGSQGASDQDGGGGGGAGGTVYIGIGQGDVQSGLVNATGGRGGTGQATSHGGAGGSGRIRVEYCESATGTTNPPATTQQLICYSAEQGPPGYASFRLPLAVADSTSSVFPVQFGRLLSFAGAGEQTTALRIPAGPLYSATLDLLISGAGSGDVTARVDIGGDGSWDWEKTAAVSDSATWTSINLAEAFNAYWATVNGRPTTGNIDVPVRVSLSKGAQVLVSNLQISSAPGLLRTLDLDSAGYSRFLLDLLVENSGQLYTLAVDVGDNGSIEWTYNGVASRLLTGDLYTAINAALVNSTDVPIRIWQSVQYPTALYGYDATVKAVTDLTTSAITVDTAARSITALREGDVTTVSATVQNGSAATGPVTVAFFAQAEGWGDWYIGSALLPPMPPGASIPVSVDWNTTGFVGSVPVKVVVDPYGNVAETNTNNNSRTVTITVEPAATEFVESMPSGWNLISFPVELQSGAIGQVLSSLAGAHGLVYTYDGCNSSDPWKSFNPSAPPYANDLSTLTNAQGIWVQMTNTGALSLAGANPGSVSIPLCTGWNLVGFPALEPLPVAEALASINGCYSLVYAFDATDTSDPWKSFNPSAPPYANDLSQLQPGSGYWIRATSNCTLTIGN